MRNKLNIVLLFGLVLFLVGCGSLKPTDDLVFTEGSAARKAETLWFMGEEEAALNATGNGTQINTLFMRAEISYWRGDFERSFDLHAEILKTNPNHKLARYSAARLFIFRDSVVDYRLRVRRVLDGINYEVVAPLTRIYLAMAEQAVTYDEWRISPSLTPFNGGRIGFPDIWNVSPKMSPWRLRDIDRAFAPETQAMLADEYVSPALAADTEANREGTNIYVPTGLNLTPALGSDGIYYLETFVSVTKEQDLWVYANLVGAARLWIDGELIFKRGEGDYASGKMARQITLEKGTHRVLLKLAYQKGYRDWFDLLFIPDGAGQASKMPLTFKSGCLSSRDLKECYKPEGSAKVDIRSKVYSMIEMEPVVVSESNIADASPIALYLTMLSGYFSADPVAFERAWKETSERFSAFAPGFGLNASFIQTRWEVPGQLRDATALQSLREAVARDPESVLFLLRLGNWIKDKGKNREVREVLEKNRLLAWGKDGKLKMIAPLIAWASYLDSQGWDDVAEAAWRDALTAVPSNCSAARRVQGAEQAREIYQTPEKITPQHKKCPSLWESYVNTRQELADKSLSVSEKYARRYPFAADSQLNYANELVRRSRGADAELLVQEAMKLSPYSVHLWNWKVDRVFDESGPKAALALLDAFVREDGNRGWIVWKRAAIEGRYPLKTLMPDGYQAAMDAVQATKINEALSKDDSYFVMDFAARQYYPDGSAITLTHTVVRVMTKNAIDRHAESQIPGGARVLLARTIKADGTTQIPEQTAGKSTLSMPGLAEGDFVELAYLQYASPREPASAIQGVRFFFRMAEISTLHSEYVILGAEADFILENAPPEATSFDHEGVRGVRFLAKNKPRPRSEPQTVPADEYLPWVQMYRYGLQIDDFERTRRYRVEQTQDALKSSSDLTKMLKEWTKPSSAAPSESAELAKQIFYTVAAHIPDPSPGDFGTDVSHIALLKEGNPNLLLKAAYDHADIDADIFLVRTVYAPDTKLPLREFQNYSSPVVRIQVDDEVFWVSPNGPDAMFGAVAQANQGQPAVCITCIEPVLDQIPASPCPTRVPGAKGHECPEAGNVRTNTQHVKVTSQLDKMGTLTGSIDVLMDGATAMMFRSGLRQRTAATARLKLASGIAAGVVPGSQVASYDVIGESSPDKALRFVVEFVRPGFARPAPDGKSMFIETRMFHEGIASRYTTLPERQTPLFLGYGRHASHEFHIHFPTKPTLGAQGVQRLESQFGRYVRGAEVDGNDVTVWSEMDLGVQRVMPKDYPELQKWAGSVEQSSPFFAAY